MIYYFRDIPRVQLLFDSPNKLAAFLCLVLPFIIVASVNLASRRPVASKLLAVVFALLASWAELLLVMTYSRGGYVAFGIGLVSLAVLGCRRASILFGGIFVMLLMIVPEASARAASFNVTQDLSIWNRLVLWKSACEICVDNPLFGVGRPVGEVFMAWYQAMESGQIYRTAVSDYLTIGARYGLPVLMLYCGTLFFVIIGLARKAHRGQSYLVVAVMAGVTSYTVAAVFSTFYTTSLLVCSFLSVLVLGSVVVALEGMTECTKVLRLSIVPLGVVCFLLCGIGMWNRPVSRLRYAYQRGDGAEYVIACVGREPVQGAVVYLFDQSEQSLESEGRRTVRHLLRPGWPVVEIGITSDKVGYEHARRLVGKLVDGTMVGPVNRIALIGQNCGGRFAFLLGEEFPTVEKVATIGAYASWPITELSPSGRVGGTNRPEVLILNGDSDWRTDVEQALALKTICMERNIPCHVRIVPGVGNDLEGQRPVILAELRDWISRLASVCGEGGCVPRTTCWPPSPRRTPPPPPVGPPAGSSLPSGAQ